MLKSINIEARAEMEKIFGVKVHLYLFVQINDNWVENKFGF